MMRALEAGGLEACYVEHHKALYELDRPQYADPTFPEGYEGKLVKVLAGGLERMVAMPGGIKVAFMLRPSSEVRESMLRVNKTDIPEEKIAAEINRAMRQATNRKDMDAVWMPLKLMSVRPKWYFEKLKAYSWPIDPEKAARAFNEGRGG